MNATILTEQTSQIYAAVKSAIIATLINSTILVFVLWSVIEHDILLIWLAAITLISLARSIDAYQFNKTTPHPKKVHLWSCRFLIGSLLASLAWGISSIWLFPVNDLARQVFLAFVIGGMAAGAVTSLSYMKLPIYLYLCLTLIPLSIRFFYSETELGITMSGMLAFYLVMMLIAANRTHSNIEKTICLHIKDVEREQILAQKAEQLQSVIKAAPLVLWSHDKNGVFELSEGNALKDMGLKPGQVVGQSLFELYADYPKVTDAAKRVLSGESFVTETEVDGRFFESHHTPRFSEQGEILGCIGVAVDITKRRQADEKLSYQASHDELTGLINRAEFERRAERFLSINQQEKGEHALCFIDLDQFKVINDTCGHIAGDELLRQLGKVLKKAVRRGDTLARLGGDEFGVLVEHCSLDQSQRVARELQNAVQEFQFSWEGQSFRVGASIGLVAINETTPNLTELLKQADAACYMAKDLGRNRIHTYHPDDAELAQRHGEMQWVARINQALEQNRFCLHAQAIVSLAGSTERHYELLLRMLDEKGEIIPPGAFLPAAERYNLIEQLDAWVIKNALTLLAAHPDFVKQVHFITINLSGPSLASSAFLASIISQLEVYGIEPGKICFEVTETVAISNLSAAITFITTLRKIGCRFALDDFGSGLSSFGYLKTLPVNYLKIDGMFVRGIVDDPIDHAMVKSINDIGHVMGMQTIAEFVENDEIKSKLKEIGVNYAQGYGIERPRPLDELLSCSKTDTNHPKTNKIQS